MTSAAAPWPRLRLQEWLGFQLPWAALLPLLLIPVLGGDSAKTNHILFATEVLLLVAGVRRPVWVVAALLMNEMTAANYMHVLGGVQVSNRLVLSALSVPVVLPHIAARADLGPRAKLTVGLGLAFVAMTTVSNMAYSDDAYVFQFLRYISLGVYLMVLIPAAVRDHEDLRDLCAFLFGLAVLAAFVGAMQHWSDSRGTPLWQAIPHAGAPGESFKTWETRAVNLSDNPILAGNVLMIAGLFALGVLLFAPFRTNTKRLIAVCLLLMTATAYFTFTRSWAVAMVPALATMALLYRGQYRREFWLIIVVLGAGLWYWSDMQSSRYTQGADTDSSVAARPVLWTLAYNIAADNPWLGVGHDAFLELSPEYASTIDPDALERAGDVVGTYTPHNDFLNVWLSWGFFALLAYCSFIFVIGRNFFTTFRATAAPLPKGLALGGLAALIGFQVNSFFHNFLDSTLTLWALAGFSLLLPKLAPGTPVEPGPEAPAPRIVLVRDKRGGWEECAV